MRLSTIREFHWGCSRHLVRSAVATQQSNIEAQLGVRPVITSQCQIKSPCCLHARYSQHKRNWLVRLSTASLICGVALFSQGCSTTSPFSGIAKPSWLKRKGQDQIATLPNQRSVAPQIAQRSNQSPINHARPHVNMPSASNLYSQPNARAIVDQKTKSAVVPVSYSTVQQTSVQLTGLRRSTGPACLAESCPSCSAPNAADPGCEIVECQSSARWDIDPQEFVCDGGDREPTTIVREDWSSAGVDSSDTVIYYETLGGKVCVQPSNRTCVYAPRFGAVRQVTGVSLAENTLAPGRVHAPLAADGVLDRSGTSNLGLAAKAIGQKQVTLLDRLHDQSRGIPIDSVVPPTPIGTLVTPSVNVDNDLADLALGREWLKLIEDKIEVVTWINPESIEVSLGEQQALFVADTQQAAEFFLYETPDKCSMRLTKRASHQMASPGDRIRFTIRFENMGSQKLGNAVIQDSLSPRLAYIEGSQKCSVEANFNVQPNEAGSSLLRWDIQSPIEGQRGGVIIFDCEVR